jgi:hypothetical protein
MDQKLGYHGKDRFVLFYYEQRGDEVMWRDSHSYGFLTGAATYFIEEFGAVAELHKVDVGITGSPGTHGFLIDRVGGRAYLVKRDEAVRFLKSIAQRSQGDQSATGGEIRMPASLATLIEITHGSIAETAYYIWEKHGKPEGQALQDWLQAEALLRAKRSASRRST